MKSYLSLIPISAKVRKQQNRMTVLCIIIAVFLVTAIFSVADMMIRTESDFMINNHGNWHIAIKNISQDDADKSVIVQMLQQLVQPLNLILKENNHTESTKNEPFCMALMKPISFRFQMEL